jgi:hypothetical protein
MAAIDCKQFLNQLDAWMEGQRTADAQVHARSCKVCRSMADDLGAITTAARSMAAEQLDPPAHVWTSLRAQLEREGLIRDNPLVRVDQAPERRTATAGWRRWFGAIPRPALAGAYLAALVAGAVALSGPISKRVNDYRWIQGTKDSTSPLSAQLNSVEQTTMASLVSSNPLVTTVLHKNLAIVDNYITLCEKSVHDEPESEVARDYLYEAYQQKADLLAQLNERESSR